MTGKRKNHIGYVRIDLNISVETFVDLPGLDPKTMAKVFDELVDKVSPGIVALIKTSDYIHAEKVRLYSSDVKLLSVDGSLLAPEKENIR